MKKLLTLLVSLCFLVACQGLNFGYKDPESGVDVTCVTQEDVTSCFYMGPDGKQIHVSGPVIGQDVKPVPE